MRVLLVAIAAVMGLAAGSLPEKDRTAAGYNDGYAVGYNTVCQAVTPSITREWGNASYGQGYAAGVTEGTLDCLADQQG